MGAEELERAFVEGHLSRRAFVRQLVDGGMDVPVALARADELVPRNAAPAPTPEPSPGRRALPERPAQAQGLQVTVVEDGYVLHDSRHDLMHSLNAPAALVFELCTGTNDEAEIARLVQKAYGLATPPEAETRGCLESLFDQGIIR